jgi:hypothetical protein
VGVWVHVLPSQTSTSVAPLFHPAPLAHPTATHAVADVHVTPLRLLLVAPVGLGVGSVVQMLPFQRSTNVRRLSPASLEFPTAMQSVAEVHATLARLLVRAPLGLGVGWIVHVMPFQCSASVVPSLDPTAVHAVTEVHETPLRLLLVAPLGAGVRWVVQLLPSQVSDEVSVSWLASVELPTSMHEVADVHARPLAALGAGMVVQVLPSIRSATEPSASEPLGSCPMARHAVAEVHDTPYSLALTLTLVALGWNVQLLPSQRSANSHHT